jgi:ABC-type multidrug transport system fused ATPase/permease subunit
MCSKKKQFQASTDQSEVDTNIADQMGTVAFSIIQLVGITAVMSQVAWQVFVVFVPVFAACVWYQVPFFLLLLPILSFSMLNKQLQQDHPQSRLNSLVAAVLH